MEEAALLTNLLADCSKIEKTILYKVTINVLLLSKNYAIITKLSETSSSYFISFFPRKIVFAKSEEEMEKMEQKNDMLVLFIFLLVIIVLVQYAKTANDPMKVLVVPMPQASEPRPKEEE